MKNNSVIFILGILLPGITSAQAANCNPGTATTDLDIANVRARIFCGADMWWDLTGGDAEYEVPKGSGKHSLYAGSIWMGGFDNAGNLLMAAQTYRQNGNDFWPGPVGDTCQNYDRLWKINRADVMSFVAGGTPTQDIMDYPGNYHTPVTGQYLAPFVDVNSDGLYNYLDGDYPRFDGQGTDHCYCTYLHGDQTIWWVINDRGNIHSETGGGGPVGLEIRCQAFAFSTADTALSNATFYKYQIINQNTTTNINQAWMGFWVDPDLGNYLDDYVGCDVGRGLAYAYNGDENDEGIDGYGFGPPAVGVKFLVGPTADEGDGIDNDRDSCIDCTFVPIPGGGFDTIPDTVLPEHFEMNRFITYSNSSDPISGKPIGGEEYYGYLNGLWRNGTKMTYGGNGHGGGTGSSADPCDFMFPGNSDPYNWGTNGVPESEWDEVWAGNLPGDRMFLTSAGPFMLSPGEVQCVTMAVLWARDLQGRLFSLEKLKQASDHIDSIGDGCIPFSTIGIAEPENHSAHVFPNPSTQSVNLVTDFPLIDAGLTLYDIAGKIIFQKNNLHGNKIVVPVKDFKAGIYLYTIKDKHNTWGGRIAVQ